MGRFSEWAGEHTEAIHAFHCDGVLYHVHPVPFEEAMDPAKAKKYRICWTSNAKGAQKCVLVTAESPEEAADMVRDKMQLVKVARNPDGSVKINPVTGQPEHEKVGRAAPGWGGHNKSLDRVPDPLTGKHGDMRPASDALNPEIQKLFNQKLSANEFNPYSEKDEPEDLKRAMSDLADLFKSGWSYNQEGDKYTLLLDAKEVNTFLRGIINNMIHRNSYKMPSPGAKEGGHMYKALMALATNEKQLRDPAEYTRVAGNKVDRGLLSVVEKNAELWNNEKIQKVCRQMGIPHDSFAGIPNMVQPSQAVEPGAEAPAVKPMKRSRPRKPAPAPQPELNFDPIS